MSGPRNYPEWNGDSTFSGPHTFYVTTTETTGPAVNLRELEQVIRQVLGLGQEADITIHIDEEDGDKREHMTIKFRQETL